jgi:predicted RNA-binding Zn-ribbon protein involved in translation (DUF1610 family)
MSADRLKEQTQQIVISSNDILFECPACGKSLVVDDSAESMIIGCPQCKTNVIVPPKQSKTELGPPPEMPRTRLSKEEIKPAPTAKLDTGVLSAQGRLMVLAGQLKEIQTQRTEITGRIASRLNEVNRDLVMLARLETSQQQILSEWNQLVEKVAESATTAGANSSSPVVVGSSLNATGRTRVQFGA